ncbi:solute carrier family 23 member 2-like [Haliotis asinina]|uniref:solute carrier family 23 member 2-like n=1 Tax=Haliotis asinina TaxID=109174 RepID=UPI00353228B2
MTSENGAWLDHLPKVINATTPLTTEDEENGTNRINNLPRTRKILYGIDDTPGTFLLPLFALQQVMTCIGGVISIPLLTCTLICAEELPEVKAGVLSISFFVCGIGTILQNTFGVRLPIIQGASPNFLAAVISMMAADRWKCSAEINGTTDLPWVVRVREIQGNLMLASLTQILLGATGVVGLLLRFIGPLTIAPTIALVGVSLAPLAGSLCQEQWGVSIGTMLLILCFALFLGKCQIAVPVYTRQERCHISRYPVFQLIPVLLSITTMWILCYVLTQTGVFPSNSTEPGFQARTDPRLHVVRDAPWFNFPHPGHLGWPTISAAGYVGMLAATIASIIESVGDYFAAARACAVPPPPAHAVNRGIMMEGLGCLIAGSVGAVHGTTSYSENIGALVVTKVASRSVFITAGVMLTVCGMLGKFGAVVSLIPTPVIGGVALVTFGMVVAVGLSTLQFVDLSSSRNLMVLGLALMLGVILPQWVTNNPRAIDTGNDELTHILNVLLGSSMLVGGMAGCILDNTAPGTTEQRGMLKWREERVSCQNDTSGLARVTSLYELAFITRYLPNGLRCSWLPVSPAYNRSYAAHIEEDISNSEHRTGV